MNCWECTTAEAEDFRFMCSSCRKAWERQQEALVARQKRFRYKGMQYADECATCHHKETVLWIVAFKQDRGGEVVGVWCEDCISGMVGKPTITSVLTFTGIRNIRFLKKCYAPPLTKAMQDVCDILKEVEFS